MADGSQTDATTGRSPERRERDLYRPTLGLIMIVKNEAENLPELLGPLQGKFDQIVIVDTGSDDGTPEIAQRYGAEVHHFPWINDFSAARNESIRHARTDWMLWLDGDDRVAPSEIDLIRKIIVRYPKRDAAFFCHLRSYGASWQGDQNLLQIRLLPNRPGIAFEGAVHERVADSVVNLGARLEHSPVEIIHTGYMDSSVMPAKFERNLELLNKMLEADPSDVSARFQLVMQFVPMGRIDEAREQVDLLAKVIDDGGLIQSDSFYRYLLLRGIVYSYADDSAEAKRCYERIVEVHPTLGVGHLLLARSYYDLKDWEKVHDHLIKAEYHGIVLDAIPIPMTQAHFDMASMRAAYYQHKGQWVLAAQELRKALNINSEYLEYYVAMGNAYLSADDPQRALASFELGLDVFEQVVARLRERRQTTASEDNRGGTGAEMSEAERARTQAKFYDGIALSQMRLRKMLAAKETLDRGLEAIPDAVSLTLRTVEWMLRMKRKDGAARWAEKALALDPESVPVAEAAANLFILHGGPGEALPWLRRLWRDHSGKWDAGLIAVLTALQTNQWAAARESFGELRERLQEIGVRGSSDWDAELRADHPMLDCFMDAAFWSSQQEEDSGSASEREKDSSGNAQMNAQKVGSGKLGAIAQAIRGVLTQAAPVLSQTAPR